MYILLIDIIEEAMTISIFDQLEDDKFQEHLCYEVSETLFINEIKEHNKNNNSLLFYVFPWTKTICSDFSNGNMLTVLEFATGVKEISTAVTAEEAVIEAIEVFEKNKVTKFIYKIS